MLGVARQGALAGSTEHKYSWVGVLNAAAAASPDVETHPACGLLQERESWQLPSPPDVQSHHSTWEPIVLRVLEPLVAAGFAPTVWRNVALPNWLAERFGLGPGAVLGSLDPFEFFSKAVSDRCEPGCAVLRCAVLGCCVKGGSYISQLPSQQLLCCSGLGCPSSPKCGAELCAALPLGMAVQRVVLRAAAGPHVLPRRLRAAAGAPPHTTTGQMHSSTHCMPCLWLPTAPAAAPAPPVAVAAPPPAAAAAARLPWPSKPPWHAYLPASCYTLPAWLQPPCQPGMRRDSTGSAVAGAAPAQTQPLSAAAPPAGS